MSRLQKLRLLGETNIIKLFDYWEFDIDLDKIVDSIPNKVWRILIDNCNNGKYEYDWSIGIKSNYIKNLYICKYIYETEDSISDIVMKISCIIGSHNSETIVKAMILASNMPSEDDVLEEINKDLPDERNNILKGLYKGLFGVQIKERDGIRYIYLDDELYNVHKIDSAKNILFWSVYVYYDKNVDKLSMVMIKEKERLNIPIQNIDDKIKRCIELVECLNRYMGSRSMRNVNMIITKASTPYNSVMSTLIYEAYRKLYNEQDKLSKFCNKFIDKDMLKDIRKEMKNIENNR